MEDNNNIKTEKPDQVPKEPKAEGEEKPVAFQEMPVPATASPPAIATDLVNADPPLDNGSPPEVKKKCLKPKGGKPFENKKKTVEAEENKPLAAEPGSGPTQAEPETKPAEPPAPVLPAGEDKDSPGQPDTLEAEIEPPAPVAPEPLVGNLQISILKDLEEINARENQSEMAESQNREGWYARVKGYYLGMTEAIKGLDDEFTRVLEKARQEATTPLPDELKSNLENRMESLDLCLKMLKRLDRFYPRFESLQQKVEAIPPPIAYIWDQGIDRCQMKLRDFPEEESRLKKDIEKARNQNYSLLRQKKSAIEELQKFFFEFMQNYFFPIIDGLDKGKKFFLENQSAWIEKFADNASLIESRSKLYDFLIDMFGSFLSKFNIAPIPVREGDPFNEQFHDPVIVETDEKEQTGQIFIHEVICQGYKFIEPSTREEQVMRLPQVIVVKK